MNSLVRRLSFLLSLSLLLSFQLSAATIEEAVEVYQAEDYQAAYPMLLELAEEDDEIAMYFLATMYYYGDGVEEDWEESFRWYERSAEAGDLDAMWFVAVMHEYGEGTKQSEKKAFQWYLEAAENDYADAYNEVGYRYGNGLGVRKNQKKSAEWYAKGADAGDPIAQANLGLKYETGEGVEQDYEMAAKLYKLSADQGYDRGEAFLGYMYENGYGVEQNLALARDLYNRAIAQGNEYAEERLLGLDQPDGLKTAHLDDTALALVYDVGLEFYKAQDWQSAWDSLYPLAVQNDHSHAQALIGSFYQNGYLGEQSWTEALKWYTRSANQGDSRGQYMRGAVLFDAPGDIEKDEEEAVRMFRESAAQGHPQAIQALEQLGLN